MFMNMGRIRSNLPSIGIFRFWWGYLAAPGDVKTVDKIADHFGDRLRDDIDQIGANVGHVWREFCQICATRAVER